MRRSLTTWLLLALLLLTLASRLAVAFADHRSLIGQDIVQDDAFYYFKIADHMARGDGPTFDGETTTSGFQPLWLLVLTPIVAATQGDGVTPIHVALAVLALFAVGSGWLLFSWVRREARSSDGKPGDGAALAALALFAISPYFLFLGVNGLETGLAIFFALALCNRYGPSFGPESDSGSTGSNRAPIFRAADFGALAGLAILARLDLALLLLALSLMGLVDAWRGGALPARLPRAALAASVALLVWLPWGLYSRATTGDWLPASGAASRQIALNFGWMNLTPIWDSPEPGDRTWERVFDPDEPPAAFYADVASTAVTAFALEHPLLGPLRANAGFEIWPTYGRYLPYRTLRAAPALMAGLLALGLISLSVWAGRSGRRDGSGNHAAVVRPAWGVMVTAYLGLHLIGYTLYCPAHWYLTRYQAPAVVVTLALGVAIIARRFLGPESRGRVVTLSVLVLLLGTQLSLYRGSTSTGLQWSDARPGRFLAGWYSVAPHLDPEKKLGAFQAGTFAWFGRRDIVNLDGKVNPDAARALVDQRLDEYIAEREIGPGRRLALDPGDALPAPRGGVGSAHAADVW